MALSLKDVASKTTSKNKIKNIVNKEINSLSKNSSKRPWESFDNNHVTRTMGAYNATIKAKQISNRNKDIITSLKDKKQNITHLPSNINKTTIIANNKEPHGLSTLIKFIIG